MTYKRTLVFFMTLGLALQSAFAETWLVFPNQNLTARQMGEKIEEFKKVHPHKIVVPVYEGLQHEDIGSQKIGQLKELFEKAEAAFFANNFAQSKTLHAQFSEAILEAHFRGAIKSYLIRSLVRQSQLQEDPVVATSILHNAISLSPQFSPEKFEFSPSISSAWTKALSTRPHQSHLLKIQLPSNGIILLDGQKQLLQGTEGNFVVREGLHHLAVLVPNSQWVVKTISVKKSHVEIIDPMPLVTGTCDSPTFLGEELPKGIEAAAYFENGCSVVLNGGTPIKFSKNYEPEIKSELVKEFSKPPSNFEKTIKSPWLWVAVGVLVAGLVIHHSQNESGRVVPVHTSN